MNRVGRTRSQSVRVDELARLRAVLDDASKGRPRTATIVGEPGIGKTRLAEELTEVAIAQGFSTCWVRCYAGAASPDYWPWARWIRQTIDELGLERVIELAADDRAWLGHVAPELAQGQEFEQLPSELDGHAGAGARLRVFEAFAALLTRVAQSGPRLLLIDDLQWADPSSAHLFGFLSRELANTNVCIVATCRDTDIGPHDDVTAVLAELRRQPEHESVALGGLDSVEVSRLVAAIVTGATAAGVSSSLGERTRGNPLFIRELLRQIGDDLDRSLLPEDFAGSLGRLRTVPVQVRDVLERRVQRVSTLCQQVLTAASVIGEEFDLPRLEIVTDLNRVELLELLDEAVSARLIAEFHARIGHYSFDHALVRDVIYDELGRGKRAELHGKVVAAIERLHGGALDAHLDELAYHGSEAALAGSVGQAIQYTRRAAESAVRSLGFEKAVRHYELLLSLFAMSSEATEAERCEALLALAHARHSAGDGPGSDRAFHEAFRLAEARLGAGDRGAEVHLGRAALGVPDKWGRSGVFEQDRVHRLEKAIEEVGDPGLRSSLLARLAAAYHWTDEDARCDALSAEAVELARECDDDHALGYALAARRFAIWSCDRSDEQLQLAELIIQLGRDKGRRERMMAGVFWRIIENIERGDIVGAERDIGEYSRYAEESGLPYYRWYAGIARATRATMRGDLDNAFLEAEGARATGAAAGIPDAQQFFGVQMLALCFWNGQLGGLVEEIAKVVETMPGFLAWRGAYAAALAAAGQVVDAQRELEIVGRNSFSDVPRDGAFLTAMTLLGSAAVRLGDFDRCSQIYRLLTPFASRHVSAASAAGYFGSIEQTLALTARCFGDEALAVNHLQRAAAEYRRIGALPFEEKMLELLGQGGVVAPSAPPSPQVDSTATEASFIREGEVWTVAYGGRTVRVRDAKGMRYLARLLLEPGRELHAVDLVATVSGAGEAERQQIDTDAKADAGAMLDPRAKAEYRSRVEDLRSELEEAENNGDLGRAELLRAELETIAHELARAVGLGGRDRRASAGAERARLNVTRAVRAAIKRLSGDHPRLGEYLEATVHTGTFCRYEPDPRRPIHWADESSAAVG